MAGTSRVRRLAALSVTALVVLLFPLGAVAQQTPPGAALAPAPGAPAAPAAPGAAPAPGTPAAPPALEPSPAPTPIPPGPPTLAPPGPAASPVVPLPERAVPGATPAGPIGPFRFAPPLEAIGPLRVEVFGTVEGEFTDNANQEKRGKDAEFRTSIAPGIAARFDRLNSGGQIVYAPRAFIRNVEDVTLDHALTLRGRWRPTPFIELSGGDDLIRSDDFRQTDDPSTRRTGGDTFLLNRASLESAYLRQPWRAGLSYSHTLVLNDAEDADDSQTHVIRPDLSLETERWGAGVGYALSRGEFGVSSSYWEHSGDARFSRRLTPALTGLVTGLFTTHQADEADEVDFIIGRTRLGVTWILNPESTLEAQAGVDFFDPDTDSLSVHPSGSVGYTQRFPWLALSLRYEEGIQERFQEVDNTGVARTRAASILLSTVSFQRLTATAALRWAENRFELTTPVVVADTRDRTWDIELGARYQLLRPLFVSAGYVLTVRTSTDEESEFVENRVRVSVTYAFNLL